MIKARLFWDYPDGFQYLIPDRPVLLPEEHSIGVPVDVIVLEGELNPERDWLAETPGFALTPAREDFVNYLDVTVRLELDPPAGDPLPAVLLSADAPVSYEERSVNVDWYMVMRDWNNTTLLLCSPDHPLRAAYLPDPLQVVDGRFYNRRGRRRSTDF